MDNRRYARPQSRDTRGSAERGSEIEELGGHEVEVVELSPPSVQRRYPAGNVWIAILIVGLVAFGAGLLWPRSGTGVPGASGGTAVGESHQPGTPATDPVPSGAPVPSVEGVAPRPTRTPAPGEWLAYDLPLPPQADPLGLWVVQNWFVLGTRQYVDNGPPVQTLLLSTTGRTWRPLPAPPAIQDLQAGTVIDGDLWFVASVTAVSSATNQIVSVTPSGEWTSLGPAKGLEMENGGIYGLDRVAGRWVATTYRYDPASESGDAIREVRTSKDGVHWSVEELPGGGEGGIVSSFRIGNTLGLIWTDPKRQISAPLVFTSEDGDHWSRSELTSGLPMAVAEVACSQHRCVAYGQRLESGVVLSTVATSNDGTDWEVADIAGLPDLVSVRGMADGFIALDLSGVRVWLSPDGIEWRSVAVLPPNVQPFGLLATNSDYVTSIGASEQPTEDGYTYVAWAGELDDLRL